MSVRSAIVVSLWCLVATAALAGNTGKIAGRIQSSENGEALVGVSVLIQGTTIGASTDVDGNYTIINIPPGTYAVVTSGVGYQKKRFTNVQVSVDFTTRLDVKLSTDVIALETVEVQAEAPMIRRDLTSSHTNIDAASIEALPVESVTQILSLQAGITQGAGGELHIRGGRSNEIAYTVNGVSISNPFDNTRTVQIATNAIQELSVVSGTFNAEYGNALSGVVNTVTKEGGNSFGGSASFYTGDYVSSHSEVFTNIDNVKPFSHTVTELTVNGPILSDLLNFFVSGRFDDEKGWLYGVREHNPSDYAVVNPMDPNDIKIIRTGDNALVPMNPSREFSGTGKLTFSPFSTAKLRYDVLYSRSGWKGYSHSYKYNPDASYNNNEWGLLNALELRHSVNATTYYTVRGAVQSERLQAVSVSAAGCHGKSGHLLRRRRR